MIYDDFNDIARRLRLRHEPEQQPPEMNETIKPDESEYGENDTTSYDAFADRFRGDDN